MSPRKQEFVCQHCGRRVYAEPGPLTKVQLCRSCFEKARKVQNPHPHPPPQGEGKGGG